MAVLPSGTVIVSDGGGGGSSGYLYQFSLSTSQCPLTPVTATKLPASQKLYILGMAVGMDGQLYGNVGTTGDFARINPSSGAITVLQHHCNGLGMAMNPLTGDMYITPSPFQLQTSLLARWRTAAWGMSVFWIQAASILTIRKSETSMLEDARRESEKATGCVRSVRNLRGRL